MSILSRPDRRSVLRAAAAAGLPAWFAAELAADEPPRKAEDKPKIALIGCGGMGRGDANNARRFGTIAAVCDVDSGRAAEAAKQFGGAKVYSDFRKLLEAEKDVSVVINATPDHWHTLVNLAALKAGKDVYSEKPLTLTIDEGKRVVAAVKEHKRILQTGSQQRSDARFRLACEVVRNGRLGKLTTVTSVLPQGLNAGPFKTAVVPKELDWDAWQGPTAETEYVPERCHFSFRYWTEYSGGTLTDWGAHHNDIALWGIAPESGGPESVEGKLLLKPVPGGYTAPAAYEATFTYKSGVVHKCVSTTASTITGAPAKGKPDELPHGVRFEGSDGWLFVTRGKIEASKPEFLNDKFGDKDVRLPVSNDHMGNFFEAVKARKQPICPAEVGHRSASVCHLAGIAVRLGRKLRWDPVKEDFVGDKEASALVAREQRKKWSYETI
ncbi:MAG: Gfo/Idh/MocA family oxidoreductase [Planctomycetes bacterium]|nr:Gfo/Idh/MocA family oxidoreductase [Planctomycetota bacterium]